VIRILAIASAVPLIGYPVVMIYRLTLPVVERRTGSYHEYIVFAIVLLVIYGGVLLGITVYWARVRRTRRRLRHIKAFAAGVLGALAGFIIYIVVSGVYVLITQGSFEEDAGNLLPVLLIFDMLFGVLVSGDMTLLLYGLRPSGEKDDLKIESIGQGTKSDRDS
jgi:glucan phosphoethanolaminetransferase (alkaline phosphatase superfamily)